MHEDKRCRPILFTSDGVEVGEPEPFPASTSTAGGVTNNSNNSIADGFAGSGSGGSYSGPGGGSFSGIGGGSFCGPVSEPKSSTGGGSLSGISGGGAGGGYAGGDMASSGSSNSLRLLQLQQQLLHHQQQQALHTTSLGRGAEHPLMMMSARGPTRSSNEWDDAEGGCPTANSSSEQHFFPAGVTHDLQ